MRAGVWEGKGILTCRDWKEPDIRDSDVLVQVAYCGMCGSDAHIVEGTLPIGDPPQVLGHEVSGTIAAVGKQVRGLEIGTPVACNFFGGCGTCPECHRGLPNLCARKFFGAQGFAEFARYRADLVHPLPDSISLKKGALLEPFATAFYAVETSGMQPGSNVLVIGAGPVGLLTVLASKYLGAAQVAVSEPHEAKRQLALAVGATHAVDPHREDLNAWGREITHGRGFDAIFDAAGVGQVTASSMHLLAPGGTLLITAVHPPGMQLQVEPYEMYRNQWTLRSAFATAHAFSRSLQLLEHVPAEEIITAVEPLSSIQEVLDRHQAGEYTKVLLDPSR